MCCGSPEGEVPSPVSLQAVEQHKALTPAASANCPCRSTSLSLCPWQLAPGEPPVWPPALVVQQQVPGHAAPELNLVVVKDFGPLLGFHRLLLCSSGAEVEQLLW